MYKIRGKITGIDNIEINTEKGDFLKNLVTIEETDTGFNHIQQFEIFGESAIKVIENSQTLKSGQYVNIDFYIKSREYKGKFYNTLMIKDARVEDGVEYISDNKPPF